MHGQPGRDPPHVLCDGQQVMMTARFADAAASWVRWPGSPVRMQSPGPASKTYGGIDRDQQCRSRPISRHRVRGRPGDPRADVGRPQQALHVGLAAWRSRQTCTTSITLLRNSSLCSQRQQDMLPGLDEADLASWLAFDDVSRRLATYADPPLRVELASIKLSNDVALAVMQVFEFADIPHLCAKSYPDVLREGALYVRPRKVPESSEVASSVEMREILELATEKALRVYVRTAERAGVHLDGRDVAARSESAVERYDAQRDGAWE
jgi:hypothetical protein